MSTVIDGSASVTINSGAILGITSGTAVASTSGTSIDFTSLPSWVKRITVMFVGVSTSGTSAPQIQLGTGSTTYTTTGYTSVSVSLSSTNANSAYTTGFGIRSSLASYQLSGAVVFTLQTGTTWVAQGVLNTVVAEAFTVSGSIALAAALTAVRITTVNGTDTFDAGSVNILYE